MAGAGARAGMLSWTDCTAPSGQHVTPCQPHMGRPGSHTPSPGRTTVSKLVNAAFIRISAVMSVVPACQQVVQAICKSQALNSVSECVQQGYCSCRERLQPCNLCAPDALSKEQGRCSGLYTYYNTCEHIACILLCLHDMLYRLLGSLESYSSSRDRSGKLRGICVIHTATRGAALT